MPRRDDGIFETLAESPWWVSVIVACFVFIGAKFIVPAVIKGNLFFGAAARTVSSYAIWIALFFLIPGVLSALRGRRRGELLSGQTSIATLRRLSWCSFEELVAEAYRRDGYSVMGNAGSGPDGGIDLTVRKDGETALVQCKQWKTQKIGVSTVREMFGLLNAEKANEVHIVTSGHFTNEAQEFARNKPIRLIDGAMLVQLVRCVQSAASKTFAESRITASRVICPKCGSPMILRKATKGVHAGREFWGCTQFPLCKGIVDIG